jgi:hypothetical protein
MSFLWGFVNSQAHASKQQEHQACLLRTQARKLRLAPRRPGPQSQTLMLIKGRKRPTNPDGREDEHREWLEGVAVEKLDEMLIKHGVLSRRWSECNAAVDDKMGCAD